MATNSTTAMTNAATLWRRIPPEAVRTGPSQLPPWAASGQGPTPVSCGLRGQGGAAAHWCAPAAAGTAGPSATWPSTIWMVRAA